MRINAAGDKQQGFIGSRQWIGAIELGFVLDTLLGVQCKVSLEAGAVPVETARELLWKGELCHGNDRAKLVCWDSGIRACRVRTQKPSFPSSSVAGRGEGMRGQLAKTSARLRATCGYS